MILICDLRSRYISWKIRNFLENFQQGGRKSKKICNPGNKFTVRLGVVIIYFINMIWLSSISNVNSLLELTAIGCAVWLSHHLVSTETCLNSTEMRFQFLSYTRVEVLLFSPNNHVFLYFRETGNMMNLKSSNTKKLTSNLSSSMLTMWLDLSRVECFPSFTRLP